RPWRISSPCAPPTARSSRRCAASSPRSPRSSSSPSTPPSPRRSSTRASAASTASASLPWGHHLPPSRYTLLYAHGFLTTAANNYPPRLLFTCEQLRLPKVFAPFSRVILTADLLVVIFLAGRATVQHCHPGDALWRVASAPAPQVFDDLISVNGTLYALVGLRLATLELSESSLELSFLGGRA
ncbi:Os11g0670800, partial [Oryza sativa Japonica Group]